MFRKFLLFKPSGYLNLSLILVLVGLIFVCANKTLAQKVAPRVERELGKEILKTLKRDIATNYYDKGLNGFDVEGHFKLVNEQIDQAVSVSHINSIITQALSVFDPMITYYPPDTNVDVNFGVIMRMIGNRCYLVAVKPGSDAEAQGAKPGVQIVRIDGFEPTRQNFDSITHHYDLITSQDKVRIIAKIPGEKELRSFDIAGKVTKSERIFDFLSFINKRQTSDFYIKFKSYQVGKIGKTTVLNLSGFNITPSEIGSVMKSNIGGSSNLILDLRVDAGTGGSTFEKPDKIEKLTGYFFDNTVKIAELRGRKESTLIQSKTQGKDAFKGKLVVLISSATSSEGQIFARLIQLEKRGIIIGDQSNGKVCQSRFVGEQIGVDSYIFFGVEIPIAKVIMSDGNTLENGVTPDEQFLPSNTDLSSGYDPVLARALELVGEKVTPEEAGKLFQIEWRKN